MRIYLDFDDVLCETARRLSELAREMYGRDVPYRRIAAFDLHLAFDLNEKEYKALMARAHCDEIIAALRATNGMVSSLKELSAHGHDIVIVTGRPPHTNAVSREWLWKRGLGNLPLHHVDKYGREPSASGVPPGARAWTLGEFNREHFDVAIDDAPAMLDILARRKDCRTIVFDRPWNRGWSSRGVMRCCSWKEIVSAIGN